MRSNSEESPTGTRKTKTAHLPDQQPELDAATVAAIYRHRWQIELLFKKLKQTFRSNTSWETTKTRSKSKSGAR
ncbi:transposase [Algoriphagus halophilus]|uniref:transposase n=1 Tax=Algoriphagus halophilus TaxID=226505 RepID=UPI00358F1E37